MRKSNNNTLISRSRQVQSFQWKSSQPTKNSVQKCLCVATRGNFEFVIVAMIAYLYLFFLPPPPASLSLFLSFFFLLSNNKYLHAQQYRRSSRWITDLSEVSSRNQFGNRANDAIALLLSLLLPSIPCSRIL